MKQTLVSTIMTRNVITADENVTTKDAIKLLHVNNIGALIITRDCEPIGIYTERDTQRILVEDLLYLFSKPVKDSMTSDLISIQEDDTVEDALFLMKEHHFRHLPVFLKKNLTGIISIRDLLAQCLNPDLQITNPFDPSFLLGEGDAAEIAHANTPLTNFQMRNIELLTHLFSCDATTDTVTELIRLGEVDYFSLIEKCHTLEQRVNIDEKTQLLKYNKRYLSAIVKTFSRVFTGTQPIQCTISMIRFDIDNFSIFNNTWGHSVGDEVLIRFAELIRRNSRPTDYVIRFGGEEFDVILPNTPIEGVKTYLDKIYEKLQLLYIVRNNQKLNITVSAGVSSLNYSFSNSIKFDESQIFFDYEELQNQADHALFAAKYLGKNRYCTYDSKKKEDYDKFRKLYKKS